jgi:hypothetical protein
MAFQKLVLWTSLKIFKITQTGDTKRISCAITTLIICQTINQKTITNSLMTLFLYLAFIVKFFTR